MNFPRLMHSSRIPRGNYTKINFSDLATQYNTNLNLSLDLLDFTQCLHVESTRKLPHGQLMNI